jgi:uncharacterized protein (TIGR02599 family)
LTIYKKSSGVAGYKGVEWFSTPLGKGNCGHVLSENVVALVLLPKVPASEDSTGVTLAPKYSYSTAPVSWPPPNPQPATESQLPPLVQVTMVAIDETSANRFQQMSSGASDSVSKLNLNNLFGTAGDVNDNTKPGYANDLKTLTDTLQTLGLNYRTFTSEVSIRGAKWSRK